MSLRIFSAVALLVVAGCGTVVEEQDGAPVACALSGQSAFTDACSAAPVDRGEPSVITIQNPDGGFRRFLVEKGGAIRAADGASSVTQTRLPNGVTEIAIEQDRYRLPAKR